MWHYGKENLAVVEQHCNTLQALNLVKEVDVFKLRIKETMFEDGKSVEDVKNWSVSCRKRHINILPQRGFSFKRNCVLRRCESKTLN